MEKYQWAVNSQKLQRALANVVARVGPKYKESDVKKLYVEYGGLLQETGENNVEVKVNDSSNNPEDNQPVKEE